MQIIAKVKIDTHSSFNVASLFYPILKKWPIHSELNQIKVVILQPRFQGNVFAASRSPIQRFSEREGPGIEVD